MMPRIWTDAEIDDILSHIRTGERTADIAAEYNIRPASLRSVIYTHRGSAVREARQDMYASMAEYWRMGWTTADIARKYDMHPQTLAHIIGRNRELFPRRSRRRAR